MNQNLEAAQTIRQTAASEVLEIAEVTAERMDALEKRITSRLQSVIAPDNENTGALPCGTAYREIPELFDAFRHRFLTIQNSISKIENIINRLEL